MGEGSFGQVFEGLLTSPTGNQRVVLKRVKTRVQGAEEMSQMEHLLNVYASRVARGHCADFLGYCEVADSEANTKLTSGLWLVWKYEGSKTLSYYLRRRDTIRALATDLEVPEGLVVQTVMRHIFEGLAAFHAAGLVHRDVKPLNMIMAEDVKKFKLIDLGACADLRSGTNYVPEESILDLNFCPPEQFVMPTDSPHIAKQAGLLKLAISPMLWAKHKPDRFDTWSAGIIMLQLAVPAMRTDRALRNFNAAYGPKYKYDLAAWRKGIHLPVRDGVLLDAEDGAGWDLLQSLLAPRHIQVDDNGGVSFVNDTPFQRISAFEALKHRYIKGAAEAAAQSSAAAASTSGSTAAAAAGPSSRGGASSADAAAAARKGKGRGSGEAAVTSSSSSGDAKGGASSDHLGSALGVWRDMTGRLFDLEARIMRQTSATELQTTTVKRLKEQVDSGKVDPALLQKEEKVLNKMQARLAGLQQDFSSTANQASGILSFFGFGGKQQQAQPQPPVADARAVRGSMDKAQQNLQALRSAGAASASAAAAAAGGASSSSASSSSSSSSSFSAPSAAGMFNSVWERLSSRLGELERKISNQASATERQSLVVRGLRAKVKAGEAEPEMLEKAERTLSRMERRLLDLDRDYWAAKQNAKGALAGNMPTAGSNSGGRQRSGSREQSVGSAADSAAAATSRQSDSDNESSGSFWSRLLGSRSGSSMDGGSMDGGSSKEAAQQASASAAAATPAQPPRSPSRSWSPMFRRSPSPTPAQQQAAAAPQQQQPAAPPPPPPPQQSGYRSIFGAFGGLGSGDASPRASTSSTDQPASALAPAPAPPAAPSSLPRSASPMRSASPRSGGFFGGLFSRPAPTQQRPVEPEPAATPPTTATSSSSASSSASSGLPVPVPPPAAPASASGGDALVEGASRVIRNSLSFTGLAAKIAGDLATAFKEDAERYMKELELQEAAKRQQRTLDLAFLALLREAQPPVSSGCSFEEAEVRFAGEARWAALAGEARRRELYGKYLQTARKVEEQAAAAADAAFRAALRRYDVSSASRWEDFRDRLLESDPAVAGVQDVGRRQQLFLEVVAELQLQAVLQTASFKTELEFTTLLAALSDPPVTSTSTWALVRRAVAADPRCQALPERRRRELFEAYTARLFEEESARTTQLAEEAARAQAAKTQAAAPPKPLPLPVFAAAAAAPATIAPVDAATSSAPDALSPQVLPVAEPPLQLPPHEGVVVEAPAPDAGAVSVAAPHVPIPVQSTPGAEAPEGAAPPLDDDDLTAALAGMEAALESAIKAVASAPRPSAFALGGSSGSAGGGSSSSSNGVGGGSGGNNVVSVSPAQFHGAGAGPVNGVFNGAAVRKATPSASPGGDGGPAAAAASEGLRLEELRREQARLRAEYEAMAQRLREMEERLKGQAQLMSTVDGEPEVEAEPRPETQAGELQAGGSGGANGNGLTHSGSDDSMAAVRGGHRWR